MKIGIEMCHGFVADLDNYEDFVPAFDRAKAFGFAGMHYKTPLYLSPSLDQGQLNAARKYAAELGLYLEFGLGRVNPYNTFADQKVWLLGGGNYLLGMEKIIKASADIGCHELAAITAGWQNDYSGYFQVDRFRTHVSWDDQLQAVEKFLQKLKPILSHYGSRVNVETHEEITSYEVLRLIEAVGEDVVGITFDTGNVLARGEDPVAAAKRVAPYCHQTHIKDAILFFSETGIIRQVKPCGMGIVNWQKILPILHEAQPELRLSIEDHKGYMPIDLFCQEWRDQHPNLNLAEMAELFRLAQECTAKINRGEIEDPQGYDAIPYQDQMLSRLQTSKVYLASVVKEYHLK